MKNFATLRIESNFKCSILIAFFIVAMGSGLQAGNIIGV